MAEAPKATHPKAVNALPPQRVLFLCVGNSARSQIAEGFARKLAPAGVEVWSAGVEPKGVNPLTVQVMDEAGIDIRGQRSKRLDDVPWRSADTVITLCGEAAEMCPAVPAGLRKLHWPIEDPVGAQGTEEQIMSEFRRARDEIRGKVEDLVRELAGR